MRTRAFFSLAIAFFPAAACSSSTEPNPTRDDSPAKAGEPRDEGSIDGKTPPSSAADPCRGVALPDDQHFVAKGLCARAVATHLGRLRQITFAPNGELFGVTSDGVVRRFHDANDNGVFESSEQSDYARLDGIGNNVHIDADGGFLYAGGKSSVKRFPYAPLRTSCGEGEAEDVVTGIPEGGTHKLHTVHVFDHFLYVHTGSVNNFVAPMLPNYDTNRSVLKRFDLRKRIGRPFTWDEGEVFAKGLRNTVGFTSDKKGRIFAVNNGIDHLTYEGRDIHEENPGDEIFRLEAGGAYGYPYCFTAQNTPRKDGTLVAPGTMLRAQAVNTAPPEVAPFTNPHDDTWCARNAKPAETFLPAHNAPLDIAFHDRGPFGALPAQYRHGAFVTLHGSWNRAAPSGYQLVFVAFDENGQCSSAKPGNDPGVKFRHEVIFGGGTKDMHVDGPWGWKAQDIGETLVRPVGVAISPRDGALYVSSDNGPVAMRETPAIGQGALYRIAMKTPVKEEDKRPTTR